MNRYARSWKTTPPPLRLADHRCGGVSRSAGHSPLAEMSGQLTATVHNTVKTLIQSARNAPPTQESSWGANDIHDHPADPDEDRLARRRVEAVLLISKSPLSHRKLAQLAGLADATQARTLVNELNELYQRAGRALKIEQIAGGSRMMTRPVVAPWLRRLGFLPPAMKLSLPMMETLAVVAYRQEVTRADIEAVRGVACGEILRQLMHLDLVRISGRSEDLGRPYLYGTTKTFLHVCGLPSIKALPPIREHATCQNQQNNDDTHSQNDLTEDALGHSPNAPSPPKESDVSLAVTDALATTTSAASDLVLATALDGEAADATLLTNPADPLAVIEDEEDDLYEKGFEDDDEDDFVDDDEDWDDEEEDDDESDEEDLDEDDLDEDDTDDGWEEVDDDAADEDWDDDGDDVDDWDDEEDDDDEEDWDEED